MYASQLSAQVLVKGKPVTEFEHQNQIFIEGRPGSDFEIKVTNHSNKRAMAVVSVDGLSIMDGKLASENSSGYLLQPFGSITIPGWMLDNSQVAKFTFGSRKDSYAQQGTGNATNCGVIGVMLIAEKVKPVQQFHPYMAAIAKGPISRSASGTWGADSFSASATLSSNSALGGAMPEVTASVNNLGTGFGDATDFHTREVAFERGEILSTLAMFYDDAKGLKARGIVLERPSRQRLNTTPNPFPASTIGCVPPKGWNSRG